MTHESLTQPIPQNALQLAIFLDLLAHLNLSAHRDEALIWLYAHYSEMPCMVEARELPDVFDHAKNLFESGMTACESNKYLQEFSRYQVLGMAVGLTWHWRRDLTTADERHVALDSLFESLRLDPQQAIPFVLNEFRFTH